MHATALRFTILHLLPSTKITTYKPVPLDYCDNTDPSTRSVSIWYIDNTKSASACVLASRSCPVIVTSGCFISVLNPSRRVHRITNRSSAVLVYLVYGRTGTNRYTRDGTKPSQPHSRQHLFGCVFLFATGCLVVANSLRYIASPTPFCYQNPEFDPFRVGI
jgi:hypothetical protein